MSTSLTATDTELTRAIVEELGWLPSVQGEHVRVGVDRGVVTLSGHVETLPEKRAAVQAAFRVRGVSAVADEIAVHHDVPRSDDAAITRAVTAVLVHTAPAPPNSVKADVSEHIVTLSGVVDWNFQRQAVVRSVEAVDGVVAVANEIAIRPRASISPAAASAGIAAALRRHAELDAEHISVSVTGSTLTLGGWVDSWREHRQAAEAAWATPGVTSVVNRIGVRS